MKSSTFLPLALTTGDPGGVGPEICVRVALATCQQEPSVIFGDARWLRARAIALGAAESDVVQVSAASASSLRQGQVGVLDVGAPWDAEALQHRATSAGGRAQLRTLDAAIAAAQAGQVRAIVTAPMSKAAVNLADLPFVGHTEHLARACGLADDDVTMMFLGPRLRVALVTTHVSIARAPAEITTARVLRSIRHLGEALVQSSRLARGAQPSAAPLLVVSGLNPHAGESGLFGDEEPRFIEPAIQRARACEPFASDLVRLQGPMPAETAFRKAASGEIDAIVAMLHDQATIASKLLDWGKAVNVTWGLPFVRTSVDHGVAYDAAQSGDIDEEGMLSAFEMAQRLT